MNRQQRRAAERQQARQRGQRRVHPAEAWMAQKIAMVKTDMAPLDTASKTDILTPTYLCLQRLQFGNMDRGDFIHLCEWNSVGGELAYQMQFHDQSGQITSAGFAFMAAAESLNAIGSRQNQTGRYVAAGDELKVLRDAVQYLSELLDLAPRGMIVAAMDKIRQLVDRKLNHPVRVNAGSEKVMETAQSC